MRYEMSENSFAASAVKAGMSFNQTNKVISVQSPVSRPTKSLTYLMPMSSRKEKKWANNYTFGSLLYTQTEGTFYRWLSQFLV